MVTGSGPSGVCAVRGRALWRHGRSWVTASETPLDAKLELRDKTEFSAFNCSYTFSVCQFVLLLFFNYWNWQSLSTSITKISSCIASCIHPTQTDTYLSGRMYLLISIDDNYLKAGIFPSFPRTYAPELSIWSATPEIPAFNSCTSVWNCSTVNWWKSG